MLIPSQTILNYITDWRTYMLPAIIAKRSLVHARTIASKVVRKGVSGAKRGATKIKTKTSAASRATRSANKHNTKVLKRERKIKISELDSKLDQAQSATRIKKLELKKLAKEAKNPYGKIAAMTVGGTSVASALTSNESEFPPYFEGSL